MYARTTHPFNAVLSCKWLGWLLLQLDWCLLLLDCYAIVIVVIWLLKCPSRSRIVAVFRYPDLRRLDPTDDTLRFGIWYDGPQDAARRRRRWRCYNGLPLLV